MTSKKILLVGLLTLTALNPFSLPTTLAISGKSAQDQGSPDLELMAASANTNATLVEELSASGEQALLEERYAAARDIFTQALALAQQQGDRPQTAHLLNQLGLSYQYLGQHTQALDLHQQALVLWTELMEQESELPRYQWQQANTWSYLMLVYQALGQYDQANEALNQATIIITQVKFQLGIFERDFIHQPTFPEAITAYRQQADTALSRTSESDPTAQFLHLEEAVTALKNLGDTYSYLERLPAAIATYQEAVIVGHKGLALARQQSQREWEARSLVHLGEAYRGMGQMHAAMLVYRQALLIYQELDDSETTYAIQQARILSRLGDLYQQWVYNLIDEPATLAIASYSQALAIYQQRNQSLEVAETLVQLHKAYPNNDISTARIENLEQSLNLYRSLDQDVRARQGEIEVLIELSVVYTYALQNPHKSLELLQEARQIAQFLDSPYLESEVLFHSAFDYHHSLNQYETAVAHYQAALALARSTGDERLERMSLHFLGDAYRDAGAYQQAIETYFELQAVADRSGNFNASRSATSGLETVYLELGYTQGAIDIYTQTLADAQQRGDRYSEIALRQLGNIYQERGEYEQALARYQEELAVLEAIGDPYGRRQYPLANIGQMYLTLGQPQAAISAYQQALAAAQTNENPVSLEIEYAFTQLAEAYLASGDIEAAIATYQQSVDFAISTWGESTDATAEALLRLANAYQEFEQWSAAISAYQQIVSIGQALASDYWQLEGLIELGIIYEAVGDAQQSHEALNQSLERITQASDRNLQVDSLIRISAVYDDLNDPQQASRVLSQAIDTVYSSPPGTIALNVDALANQLIASGDSARAIDFYQQVLTLNRDEKYRVGLMRQLAEIYKSNQQFQAALEIYQQVLVLSRERRYCQIWCMARN